MFLTYFFDKQWMILSWPWCIFFNSPYNLSSVCNRTLACFSTKPLAKGLFCHAFCSVVSEWLLYTEPIPIFFIWLTSFHFLYNIIYIMLLHWLKSGFNWFFWKLCYFIVLFEQFSDNCTLSLKTSWQFFITLHICNQL